MTTTTGTNTGSVTLTTVATTTSVVNSVTNITSTATVNTTTIGETAYTYMRAKTIEFTATGLKPNTQYYPFFNRVYVGGFCSAENGKVTSDLKTNALGELKGNFFLPANTFLSGSYTFSLVDGILASGSTFIPDPIYGQAEAQYEANGVLKTQQTQVTINSTANTNTTLANTTTTTTVIPPAVTVLTPAAPTPSTNVSTVVNNTPAAPVTVTPAVAPPVEQCESWHFEYAVVAGATTRSFTIVTNDSTPPKVSTLKVGSGGVPTGLIQDSLKYVSTAVTAKARGSFGMMMSRWAHTYSARTSYGGSTGNIKRYRQDWIGKTTDTKPSLTGWTVSGVTGTVQVITDWVKDVTTACPVKVGLGTPILVGSTNVGAVSAPPPPPPPPENSDPIAQSFYIDPEAYPTGVFITTIGLYFRTVDQSTPVILEVRNMVNGLPGPQVFPGGKVLLSGAATSQSPNATVETFFKFDHPIYLQPSQYYCFVVRSPSLGYSIWGSKLGERDVTTDKVIDANPYSGSLFLSENNYSWTPDQTQDLKFNLYIAEFDTSKTADIVVRPQVSVDDNAYIGTAQNLPISFISTTKNSKNLTITIPMHGLSTGDSIFIKGIGNIDPEDETVGYNNILAADLNGEHQVTVVDEDTVTVTLLTGNNATKSGPITSSDERLPIDVASPVALIEPTIVDAQPVINYDNLSPSTIPTADALVHPTVPTIANTTSFIVYTNIHVNEVMIDYLGTELNRTSITERISMAAGKSIGGAEVPYSYQSYTSLPDKTFYSFDEPRLIATPANETKHALELLTNKSATVNMKMTSSDKNISPVVDVTGISLMTKTYVIDNQNGELDELTLLSEFNDSTTNSEVAPGAGNALAKYKTVIRSLTQSHNKMTVFVTANCPSPAVIDAYVRTSSDRETHQDRNWVWAPINGVFGTQFANSIDKLTTNEWMFEVNVEEPFNVYDIKLVMRSTNNSIVPKIYGVRTITQIA